MTGRKLEGQEGSKVLSSVFEVRSKLLGEERIWLSGIHKSRDNTK